MESAEEPVTTVLLIEDECIIRMGTSAMLEDAGYCVLEAGDVAEATRILAGHPEIDLVITDVQMPGDIDGLGLITAMSTDYPAIRTLVTSGRASPRDALGCGATKFLAKPYTATALQSAVLKALVS